MLRHLLLAGLATLCAAGEAATVLRGRFDPAPPPGLTVAVAKDRVEDPAAADGGLASAAVGADGSFSIEVGKACESYAVTAVRDGRVQWGRSHVKPGTDLGAIPLPKAGGGIEGAVNGADGKPLPGVKLRLWRKHDNSCSHWTLAQALTADAEGGFALSDLPQGVWGVSLDDPAWAPTRRDVTVGAGAAIVELAAKPAASVGGTVTDAEGKPVAGATVGDDDHQAKTGADGTYRLGGLGEGEVRLRASAPGLALPDNAPVEVKLQVGKAATADFKLQPAGSLKVAVTLEDAAAVPPAEVQVELYARGAGGHDETSVPLKDGVARLADLGPGSYELRVKAKGAGTARLPVTIAGGQELAAEVRLPRVYAYSGTLSVPEGVDRSKVDVSGWVEAGRGEGFSFSSHQEAELDAEGRFRFTGLEAGQLRLSFKAPGCVPQSHRIAIGPGGESEGSFALTRGASVRLRITAPDGKPIAGAKVRIDNRDGDDWNAESGEDGTAELTGLIDGKLEAQVEHDEWRPAKVKLTVPAAEPVAVTLEAGLAITGTVLDAEGKPLAEAFINAWSPRGDGGNRSTRSGADGAFRLAGLKPGVWQLNAHHEGETIAQLKAVAAGASGLKLQAKAQVELVIAVTRPDGTPAAGLALVLDPEDGQNQQLTTGADGKATAKLRRGTAWQLSGKPEGLMAVATRGTVPEADAVPEVAVRLSAGRTLNGKLLGADGKPVAGLGVSLMRQDMRRGGDGHTAQPGADGAFTLTGLPPGPAMLMVTPATGRGQLLNRDVLIPVDADPAPLELVLPPLGGIAGKLPVPPRGKATVVASCPAARVQVWAELGADGTFRLAPLPAGSYTVMVRTQRGEGGAPQTATCTVAAGADTAVIVGAAAPGESQLVRGRVILPEGVAGRLRLQMLPDPDRPLTATGIASFNGGDRSAQAGEDGAFTFAAVGKGRHLLQITVHGTEGWQPLGSWRTPLTVADQPLDLELTVRGLTLPVRVLDPQGQPLVGANITAIPGDGQPAFRWAAAGQGISGEDGTAQVRWLDGPMVCDVVVWHGEHGRFVRNAVAVRAGMAPVELRFGERLELRGKVAAPAGAVVRVVARSPDGFLRDDVTADEQGAYAFVEDDRLHPGTWDLWAFAGGCAVAHRRLELAAGAPPPAADFALVPGGRLVLRVTAPPGRSVLGLEPTAVGADGAELARPRFAWEKNQLPQLAVAPIEEDGSGEIDSLAPGRWTVSVPGAKPVTVEVKAGETATAELRLE